MRDLYREVAEIIRTQVTDRDATLESRERVAAFSRKSADSLRRGDPSFSYEWFFGTCGLDSWGELLPVRAE